MSRYGELDLSKITFYGILNAKDFFSKNLNLSDDRYIIHYYSQCYDKHQFGKMNRMATRIFIDNYGDIYNLTGIDTYSDSCGFTIMYNNKVLVIDSTEYVNTLTFNLHRHIGKIIDTKFDSGNPKLRNDEIDFIKKDYGNNFVLGTSMRYIQALKAPLEIYNTFKVLQDEFENMKNRIILLEKENSNSKKE